MVGLPVPQVFQPSQRRAALSRQLAILAGVVLGCAYSLYLWQTYGKQSTPNLTTWLIGFPTALVNYLTYTRLFRDRSRSAVALVAVGLTLLVALYALWAGAFTTPKWYDMFCTVMAMAIGMIWYYRRQWLLLQLSPDAVDREEKERYLAGKANITLQFVFLASFLPTLYGLWLGTGHEYALAWFVATAAYGIQILAIRVDWDGRYSSFAFPVINGIICNGAVAVLAAFHHAPAISP